MKLSWLLLWIAGAAMAQESVPLPASVGSAVVKRREAIALPVLGLPTPNVPGKQNVVRISDGSNELIYVALGFPNRISTPFPKPRMMESTGIKFVAVGQDLYFIPTKDTPIAGFIINEDGKGGAANVTLVPRTGLPGQNILLMMDSPTERHAATSVHEAPVAPPSGYIEGIKELLRSFVRGHVPSGFQQGTLSVGVARVGSVAVVPEKVFEGSIGNVYRYQIENIGKEAIELNEASFGEPGVRAVAFWPRARLAPGETTQVWIIAAKGQES